MLVVTRRKNESILIGDDIELTITQVENGTVKIAIKAPKNITILRKELLEAVKDENKKAAVTDLTLLKNIKFNK